MPANPDPQYDYRGDLRAMQVQARDGFWAGGVRIDGNTAKAALRREYHYFEASLAVGRVLDRDTIGAGITIPIKFVDGNCVSGFVVGGADVLPATDKPINIDVLRNGTVVAKIVLTHTGALSLTAPSGQPNASTIYLPGDKLSLVVSATDTDATNIDFTLILAAEAS